MALSRFLLYEQMQFKSGGNSYERIYSINHCDTSPPRATTVMGWHRQNRRARPYHDLGCFCKAIILRLVSPKKN